MANQQDIPADEKMVSSARLKADSLSVAQMVVAVFLGGFVGTGLRFFTGLFAAQLPPLAGYFGWDLWFVNLAGAFFLGWWNAPRPAGFGRFGGRCLQEQQQLAHPRSPRWQEFVTIMVGTGLLGSFTTYSSLFAAPANYGYADFLEALFMLAVGVLFALCGWKIGARTLLAIRTTDPLEPEQQRWKPESASQQAEEDLEEKLAGEAAAGEAVQKLAGDN